MISAERQKELRDVRTMLEKLRGQELPRYAADLLITLIANELSQQGLSQEDRAACNAGASYMEQISRRYYPKGAETGTTLDKHAAILRRLGGQMT